MNFNVNKRNVNKIMLNHVKVYRIIFCCNAVFRMNRWNNDVITNIVIYFFQSGNFYFKSPSEKQNTVVLKLVTKLKPNVSEMDFVVMFSFKEISKLIKK
jgi:hypothetical protein